MLVKEAKSAYQPNRLIYYAIILQFSLQIFAFVYLYLYVARLDSELRNLDKIGFHHSIENESIARRKRSSELPTTEDNAVLEVYRVSELSKLISIKFKSSAARHRYYYYYEKNFLQKHIGLVFKTACIDRVLSF